MQTLREWTRRLLGTFRRRPLDRELEEELRLHLDLATEDILGRGTSQNDARRAARLQEGGVAQAMDALRDQLGLPWLRDLTGDLRHALAHVDRVLK